MAKFIKHPNSPNETEDRINLDLIRSYRECNGYSGSVSFSIIFSCGINEGNTWYFKSREERDKCLKEIDDLLLTK